MSLWNNQTPPVLYPDAVATPAGWADPVTGELLVTVTGLSTFKNEGAGTQLINARIIGAKVAGADPIVYKKIFAAGDVIVVEAIFMEPVVKSGGTPTMTITLNGNARTFTNYTDTSDFVAQTKGKITSITNSGGGTGYAVGDQLTFTGGGGAGAKAVVTTLGGSNAITGIEITDPGYNYTSAPTVGGGSGSGATLTAVVGKLANGPGTARWLFGYTVASAETATTAQIVWPSSVTGVFDSTEDGLGSAAAGTAVISSGVTSTTVSSGGTGYLVPPFVTFTGGTPTVNATGTANLDQSVASIAVTAGGSNYTSAPTVTFTPNPGTSASATAVLATSGGIKSVTVGGSGTSYVNSDPLIFTPTSGGSGAAGHINVTTGNITSVTMTAAGTGYITAPTVTVGNSDLGTGNTLTAVIGKAVVSVGSITGGSGFSAAPVIGFTGGGGSAATATATMSTLTDVLSITITNPGNGYVTTPNIVFASGPGSGAAATGTASSANTVTINITSGGIGYTSAPTVTGSGGSGTASALVATLSSDGVVESITGTFSGYTVGDVVTFAFAFAQPGSGATATATRSGAVDSVTITDSGSQYWNVPTVSFTPTSGGSGAAGTAVIAHGVVTGVTMTNPGSSYGAAPTVSFTEPSTQVTNPTFNGTPSAAGFSVNGVAPTITAAAISGFETGTTFITNNNVTLTLTTSVPVYVVGSPYITIDIDSVAHQAMFTNGSGTTSLVFQYEIAAADNCTSTEFTITSPVVLNSGTMKDFQGNNLTLTFTAPTVTAVVVNTPFAPYISAAAVTGGPNFTTSETISVTLTTNVDATVNTTYGTPFIQLNIGAGVQEAAYASGSGSTSLVFTYTVQSTDIATPRALSVGSLFLNGGTIQDGTGDNFPVIFTAPDTTEDTVNSSSVAAWGAAVLSGYNSGTAYITSNTITLTLTASEDALVSTTNGTPYIELFIGNGTKFAIYTSGSGSTSLVFKYTVLSSDSATIETFSTGSTIQFNGGSITDGSGNYFPEDFSAPSSTAVTVN